jgi:hypothetical protein
MLPYFGNTQSTLTYLCVKAERFVKLFSNSVTEPQGPEGAGLQLFVFQLFGEDELLVVDLQGLLRVGHLQQDVAHIAQGPESSFMLFRCLRKS